MLARGPSPLYRFLPYWVVAQINSFALLLLPVLVLLFPLFRVVPGLYDWRMRARVYRHYVDLCAIDDRAMVETDPSELARLGRRLDAIEADMVTVSLPLSYREYAYTMRMHIELVRARLAARLGGR